MRRPVRCLGSFGSLALAVTAIAAAVPAYAADLPVAPEYNPPVAYRPVIYDWTGFYFGGHVGLGLLEDSVTQTATTTLQTAGSHSTLSPYGLIGGAQIGFNYQFSSWVIGAEGTFTAADISGSHVSQTLQSATNTITERSTSAPHWYATATGRVGYALNDLLFYAKGGAAWMRATYTQDVLADLALTSSQIVGATRGGFVVGAGVEYGITENLSAKFEYDFLDFGSRTYAFNNLSASGAAVGNVPVAIKSDTHMFLFGMNYRFNWGGGGPVVTARY
jgi:outer membrane immunogenic protein